MYLVGLLADGPEREQLVRSKWHNNYTGTYYVYRMGEWPGTARRWKYEEMLDDVFYKTRRRQGEEEFKKLLKSRNKSERDTAARFVEQKAQEKQDKINER